MLTDFQYCGWSKTHYDGASLDEVSKQLSSIRVNVESYDCSEIFKEFMEYIELPEYKGEYKIYGGADNYCLLEKALEHFISFKITQPAQDKVCIDVGSCQSVVPDILRKYYNCFCYEQDLVYPEGINKNQIGGSADCIPLPGASVDFMTLHCAFEHFEGTADISFIKECARLLKPNGKVVILPLYLNSSFCNITGKTDSVERNDINFDPDAEYYCVIPEWSNRFGRHYSVESFSYRIIRTAKLVGLKSNILRVKNLQVIHPNLWLNWVFILEKVDLKSIDYAQVNFYREAPLA